MFQAKVQKEYFSKIYARWLFGLDYAEIFTRKLAFDPFYANHV